MLKSIAEEADLKELLEQEVALLYKHSRTCWISGFAERVVESFATEHPDVPIYMVDVRAQRAISQRLARELGVQHESPQTIVVRRGEAVWWESHMGITRKALQEGVGVA